MAANKASTTGSSESILTRALMRVLEERLDFLLTHQAQISTAVQSPRKRQILNGSLGLPTRPFSP